MANPNLKIKMNHAAVRELERGAAMQALLLGESNAVARRAGPGIEVDVRQGRNRARGTIRTATDEARLAQQNNGTLRNALRSHR